MPDRAAAYGELELRLHLGTRGFREMERYAQQQARLGLPIGRERVRHRMRHPPDSPSARRFIIPGQGGGGYRMSAFDFLVGQDK